jgi:hypothetical protein
MQMNGTRSVSSKPFANNYQSERNHFFESIILHTRLLPCIQQGKMHKTAGYTGKNIGVVVETSGRRNSVVDPAGSPGSKDGAEFKTKRDDLRVELTRVMFLQLSSPPFNEDKPNNVQNDGKSR